MMSSVQSETGGTFTVVWYIIITDTPLVHLLKLQIMYITLVVSNPGKPRPYVGVLITSLSQIQQGTCGYIELNTQYLLEICSFVAFQPDFPTTMVARGIYIGLCPLFRLLYKNMFKYVACYRLNSIRWLCKFLLCAVELLFIMLCTRSILWA